MKRKIISYSICLAIEIGILCLVIFSKDVTKAVGEDKLEILCDGFFVPGIIFSGFGLLVVCSNGGAFDMIAYGTMSLIALFYRNPAKRKYHTFYEYRKHREEEHAPFWHFLITGLLLIAVAAIFLIILYAKYY